jgi:hypothetical protein
VSLKSMFPAGQLPDKFKHGPTKEITMPQKTKRYYLLCLEVDEEFEGTPDHDEVCLHIENDMLSTTDGEAPGEFGITDAKCQHIELDSIPDGHSRNWLLKRLRERLS